VENEDPDWPCAMSVTPRPPAETSGPTLLVEESGVYLTYQPGPSLPISSPCVFRSHLMSPLQRYKLQAGRCRLSYTTRYQVHVSPNHTEHPDIREARLTPKLVANMLEIHHCRLDSVMHPQTTIPLSIQLPLARPCEHQSTHKMDIIRQARQT
jgi:hypothetical protein